jgi:hypothetical protein
MNGSFNIQFFDLLTYLLPGITTMIGILIIFKSHSIHSFVNSRHLTHFIILGFVFSFILGFLINTTVNAIQGSIDRIVGSRALQRRLSSTPETNMAMIQARKKFTIDFVDQMAMYRYIETIVNEKIPSSAASAARLTALALFSRNMIPAVLITIVSVLWRYRSHLSARLKLLILFIACILEITLWHGYNVYIQNSTCILLRAFSAWCDLS